jgi:hypothetical protein
MRRNRRDAPLAADRPTGATRHGPTPAGSVQRSPSVVASLARLDAPIPTFRLRSRLVSKNWHSARRPYRQNFHRTLTS